MRALAGFAHPAHLDFAAHALRIQSSGSGGTLGSIFSDRYLPHRYCYLAQPGLIWSNVISDALIALSYVALFSYLMFIARRVSRIPQVREYTWVLVAFGAFILTCAATHFMEVITVWWPFYPLAAAFKVVCAVASVPTAVYFSGIAVQLADSIEGLVSPRGETANSPRTLTGGSLESGSPIRTGTKVFSKEAVLLRMFSRGLVLAILLNVPFGVLLWQTSRKQSSDTGWVSHSQSVQTALQAMVLHLLDFEASGRGFSLTGNPALLDAYGPGRSAALAELYKVRQLTADSPSQQKRLDRLNLEMKGNLAAIEEFVNTRRASGVPPTRARIDYGKQLMDQTRGTIQEMDDEEQLLLGQRVQRAEESRGFTVLLVWTGGLLNIMFLGASALVLFQQVRAISLARADMDALNASLEQRVKERTAELSAERHKLQTVLDGATNVAIISTREDGIVTLFNCGSENLLGYTAEEIVGKRTPVTLHLESEVAARAEELSREFGTEVSPFEAIVARAVRGLPNQAEWTYVRKDGARITLNLAVTCLRGESGEIAGYIGIGMDVTERKRQERAVAERTAQLQAANQELEQFAYVASHDLKAPLRVIDNASRWLEEDLGKLLTGEAKESLDLMRTRVKRMEKLLDDLLEYARLGRVTDQRYSQIIAGDLLVADIVGLIDAREFTITFSPEFATIRLPRMPIQQILMNLVGNAIKHHDKPPGKIAITVIDLGESFEFTVKDDGPGIAPQFHAQIFKMFQTLRPRDQVEGSGMGLALVQKLVEISGGKISIESALGEGSTFRFSLPKAAALQAAA